MPLFSFGEWTCVYDARGGHTFTGPSTIRVRPGAFAGQLVVQRNFVRRLLNLDPNEHGPKVYGLKDGGYQGGDGIELHPRWTRDRLLKLDGTMMRHDVGHFNADGEPTLGDGRRYALSARELPNGYQCIDGPHYIRAYSHAIAAWAHSCDPVARMWLILCAYDVIRRFPLVPFTDGDGPSEYSLAVMERNVAASPHQGALGITRENAWALRCVVEAYRVSRSLLFATWIERFVRMLEHGQSFGGAIERHSFADGLAQEADDARALGMQPGEEWCTSWQTPFLIVAVNEARKLVRSCSIPARTVMVRLRPWYREIPFVGGDVYNGIPTAPGLPRYLVVAENGRALDKITRGYGPARAAYDGDAMAAFGEVGIA